LRQVNSLQRRWLGYLSKLSEKADTRSILMRFMTDEARYVGVASGLETGIEILEPGDILFLCTDGLVGSDRDPDPTVLAELAEKLNADRSLVSRVEEVISSALRRGETDNISCVAARISSAST
jgi:serine/threonine protein phosphatase PrpC